MPPKPQTSAVATSHPAAASGKIPGALTDQGKIPVKTREWELPLG